MPKVSIMLVTHNRCHYTREAIESVLGQDFLDWEMIVLDDGSEEKGLLEMVKGYSDSDCRIKFFPHEHMDIPLARQTALKYTSGDYLAIIDNDDLWFDKEKLKKQVEFLDLHNEYIAVGGAVIVVDKDGQEIKRYLNPLLHEDIVKSILYKNPIAHSSVLMRMSSVKEVGGYNKDLTVGEDYDLYLRLGLIGKLANLPDYVLKYRRHNDNRSGQESLKALKNNLSIIKNYRDKYPGYRLAYLRRKSRLIIYQFFSILFRR